MARRVSRSISRVLSRATIHLGRSSPIASSGLPGSGADHTLRPLFGLAPGGVYLAEAVARPRGALLPHPFTLTNRSTNGLASAGYGGGLLSAALAVGSHPPGVTWRPVLWSPDFPHAANDARLLDRLAEKPSSPRDLRRQSARSRAGCWGGWGWGRTRRPQAGGSCGDNSPGLCHGSYHPGGRDADAQGTVTVGDGLVPSCCPGKRHVRHGRPQGSPLRINLRGCALRSLVRRATDAMRR